MRYRASVRLEGLQHPDRIAEAMTAETEVEDFDTVVEIKQVGAGLVLEISSPDAQGLRAALNSWLRWTRLAIDMSGGVAEAA